MINSNLQSAPISLRSSAKCRVYSPCKLFKCCQDRTCSSISRPAAPESTETKMQRKDSFSPNEVKKPLYSASWCGQECWKLLRGWRLSFTLEESLQISLSQALGSWFKTCSEVSFWFFPGCNVHSHFPFPLWYCITQALTLCQHHSCCGKIKYRWRRQHISKTVSFLVLLFFFFLICISFQMDSQRSLQRSEPAWVGSCTGQD